MKTRTVMTDHLAELFRRSSTEMSRHGLTRFADCMKTTADAPIDKRRRASFIKIGQVLGKAAVDPVDCLMAASAAGLFPSQQPPDHLSDSVSRNRHLLEHLERREYRVRTARVEDLPALMLLERRCWAPALRTPKAVLKRRIARYPQGQLALLVDDAVVGVIYSQRIGRMDALNGMTAARVDSLHDATGKILQLLAVNILPEMQLRNLGDQLLEFMLISCSLQKQVESVIAVTLCRNFDRVRDQSLEAYIRQRNENNVLADPILRFHELHGATIERVMPGYRPGDLKNDGCGVLVSYDIHRRRRNDLRVEGVSKGPAKGTRLARSELRDVVRHAVSDCLGEDRKAAFSFDRPLMEMGLDSADLLELNEKIAQRFQMPLSPTFFFQYNTVEKIAGYLSDHVAVDEPTADKRDKRVGQSSKARGRTKRKDRLRERDVAIVGMACRLPGGINTPEEFWACLQTGVSVIGSLPAGRWQWPDGIDPADEHRGIDRGGFLDDVAAFDAPFFRVSPAEAESMDPQQRMSLELCWQAIEHAGYAPASLAGSRTGVFIGASGSDYARLLDQARRPAEAHYGTGSSMAVLANRISYFYDWHGPSLLLDTACSSSLVAVHEAVRSIAAGESAQALVGGINLILHPATGIAYYKAGMLSKDGLCRAFDQKANGYVRSEGAVVLLLKPLRSALSDHDRIYAVIKGTACNHGGQAGGLTVPNPEQQARLLQAAWQAAEIDPRALGYIEAHGTGTSLGDPIEVQGIRQAFAQTVGRHATRSPNGCALGSVKTNLGHLEAAAGIAGLLKAVLCLQHRQLPATLHFQRLNEHIELADSGLHVVDRSQPWRPPADGEPRVAGVSSFGSGGTNAHVVVAEYPSAVDVTVRKADAPVLFVLSARTLPQLQAYARRYADWLTTGSGSAVRLGDLAYQLQTGRQAMEERLALVAADRRDLIRKLGEFCSNPGRGTFNSKAVPAQFGGLTQGEAGQAFLRALVARRDLDRIALLWLAGVEVDWSLLYGGEDAGGGRPQRVAAPTYPFARHVYWLPGTDLPPASRPVVESESEAARHPVAGEATPLLLAPVWRPVVDGKGPSGALFPGPDANLLVVGASRQQLKAIRSVYAAAQSMDIDPAVTIDALNRRLSAFGDLDHILWVAPQPGTTPGGIETLTEQQRSGLLHIFKLAKALLARSYGDRDLGWTVVTWRTQAVFNGDVPDPAHAGVHGFVGALAKEIPRWSIRSLDMESGREWPVRESLSLPADREGEVLAGRSGQWFRRFLSPASRLPDAPPAYRQNGVYVVIGGAGGLGEAWTRHVIEHYEAQVIWIGRRRPDAVIQAKLEALASPGPAPVYIAADASDLASLQAAYAAIRRTWPAVHGVIHAATGLFDRGVTEMDEQRFRDILSVKIDASVHVAQVFKAEPLDFILYFSSVVALEKNGGLSGYAAGGAFEDAFALHLHGRLTCPVKVINWGHWDIGTGAVIPDATKTRLRQSGYVSIQPNEAMAALQKFLTAPTSQLALLKTSRPDALPLIDTRQDLQIYADTIPSCIEQVRRTSGRQSTQVETLQPLSLFNNAAMEARLLPLLAGTLQSLGLLDGADREAQNGVAGLYRLWLEASRKICIERGTGRLVPSDLARAWRDWESAKRDSLGHADLGAAIDLVETCLRGLPDILSGRTRATDIIFPGSSMRRVEGIYRDNAVADDFNRILAGALVAAIEGRLESDPDARLHILEIGAGTGGTTAMVLPRLAPYRRNIAEYAYTDVSKAFLFHAEEQFVGQHPYVRPRLFDVEKPLAGQSVEADRYDMVIATNVLHATRNIRRTLSTCKAALRKNGLLLLNELSGKSLFAHLTFGLLEGWWLPEDRPLRIPDAPGLYPATWQEVLRQEGFPTVVFPAPGSHVLGQQVIVAESDGVVRQTAAPKFSPKPTASVQRPAIDEAASPVIRGSDEALKAAANLHLKRLVAKTLRMDSDGVDVREPLEAYGIDSILVGQITAALREIFPDVGSTLLFECQTIDALSDYFVRNSRDRLIRLIGAPAQNPPSEPMRSAPAARTEAADATPRSDGTRPGKIDDEPPAGTEAVAVIGMSCRFPGADTVDDYWQILKSGRSCIREIPPERWPLQGFFHADPDEAVRQGKSYSKWGGFLDGVTEFDPLFFNISPKEAVTIDPQERLFLQTAWETLEDAGYTRERLAKDFRRQLGVFVGITRTGFDLFGPPLWQRGVTLYPRTSFSSVANRLSYFLNARGPSVPVDTMCSSSLTAIHQACQSLRSGECELALAGGVNVYLHPSGYVGLSASRMLSKDGVCRSFGKGGDGFVPGEGVAAVLLKPLSRAIADKDRIYAVIRATHVNHGGKTNGYTVPNPLAQAELVRDALRKAGVDARAVSYIEAHGTGTELGDPIEVAGLTQAFRHFTPDTGFCALGSAKSNVGHLEAAAGIAGFVKVVLQMRHGQLAPSLHAAELNPNIDFAKTPFVVQQMLADWQRPKLRDHGEIKDGPRIAGISSFGAGGANAHVIVEEYPEPQALPPDGGLGCVIVLSAKNEERLKASAARLCDFIGRRIADATPPTLPDLAYTLQVGREQMDQRLALVVYALAELREKLQAYVEGSDDVAGLYAGHARQHKDVIGAFADDEAVQETMAAWFRQGRHSKLLRLWTKGLNLDWERLHRRSGDGQRTLRRIGLPTYPFAKTRYWLPVAEPDAEDRLRAEAAGARTPEPGAAAPPPDADPVAIAKPNALTLRDPASVPRAFQADTSIRQLTLRPLHSYASLGDNADTVVPDGGEASLAVHDLGDGILAVRPDHAARQPSTVEGACAALTACIEWVNKLAQDRSGQGTPAKVLLLSGLDRMFSGDDIPAAAPSIRKAVAALAGCTVPVIAVTTGENRHNAMLTAAACDVMICSAEGSYGFHSPEPSASVYRLFAERFGRACTDKLVGTAGLVRGAALRQDGFTMPVVASAEVEDCALNTARNIARASPTALAELKKALSRRIGQLAEGLAAPLPSSGAGETSAQTDSERLDAGFVRSAHHAATGVEAPRRVALASDVVALESYANGVVVVKLCDRTSKNASSPEFVRGVLEAFAHINDTPEYKVAVLTGYDHYFACGGTREGLLAIQRGKARFTDEQSYSMPLACEIPVIAAMQGHAIGAGWAMGLFCDWAVYSEESVYQSPYLLYGFTPGAGSTLIFPERLGHDLSREALLTAREFRGRELKQRGIDMPVLPRNEVLGYALALANHLASSGRQELVRQKNRRSRPIRERLQAAFAQELAMHDKTFVGNRDVAANIDRYFDGAAAQGDTGLSSNGDASARGPVRDQQLQKEILEALRESLAEELHIPREHVDGGAAFTDMGMDSISAVTWIRKLNEKFSLSLAAKRIYSYPNLTSFAELVFSEMGHRRPARHIDPGPVREDADQLRTWLREALARELLISDGALSDDTKFVDLGLDSVTAVTWIRTINDRYGLSVAATKVYSYPTLSDFHRYLLKLLNEQGAFGKRGQSGDAAPPAPAVGTAEPSRNLPDKPVLLRSFPLEPSAQRPTAEPSPPIAPAERPERAVQAEQRRHRDPQSTTPSIAIIGMAGQFPKADDVKQFWRNLTLGRECISDVPPTRWSIDEYYDPDRNAPGKTVCKRMGLLDDVDVFDPLFFNISPSEAEYMDPQQRLFLQNSWRCIEDAGYDPTGLSGSLCGVFVGCAAGDYSQLSAGQPHSAQGLIGESVAILPARIAYVLNLQGPCLAIDTACSASLVALASACDSLVLGNSDLALAGGVYVINGPDIHVKMSKAGMLSPDGRCFSFDQRANGFVPGEGVGVLLLKRLEDAERDGDDIYGVIRGWGVNQDGKTNGITAPNQESQTRLETGVYRKFGINPEHIQLVEAHGTGTRLGDPIEVDALRESFRQFTDRSHFCALGSVKSNIGHLATAAGVSGVIKSVLALQHRQLPPTINYETLNEHISLEGSPFYVNTQCRPWHAEAGQKRLAAVSSFGFSGTNAHMVLEEFARRAEPASGEAERSGTVVLLPLSARSSRQLVLYARAVSDYLAGEYDGQETGLADIAYTFQTGRPAMSHRLAVVASTIDELRARLDDYASTGATGPYYCAGEVGRNTASASAGVSGDLIEGVPTKQDLAKAAERWVAGETIDWASLRRAGQARRRHGLPTYPFERERYWIPQAEAAGDTDGNPVRATPQGPSIDSTLWRRSELADTIDWQGQLRHCLGKRVLVVHADDGQRQAFSHLLTQLRRACGLEGAGDATYCRVGEAKAALAAKKPDYLLFLGGVAEGRSDETSAMLQCLKDAKDTATVIVLVQADAMTAERLGRSIAADAAPGLRNCLLVSQSDCAELNAAMQRLFKEWLAFGMRAGPVALSEIHYAGAQRLSRVGSAERRSDRICLINKEWQPKAPETSERPRHRGTGLVLVSHESWQIARELLEPGDFKRIVLVDDTSVPSHQAQGSVDFSDANAARTGAQALIDRYADITHIIDLTDIHGAPRSNDGDHSGKTVFYQTLIGTCDDVSVLYLTKELQPFRTSRMSLAGARFAGLVKMLSADYRHVDARAIDIDQAAYDDPGQLRRIVLRELDAALQETEICYREGQRFAPVLSAVEMDGEAGQPGASLQIAEDAVYVISGGTNGVGLEIAKYLAGKGCSKLVLMGITQLPPKEKWLDAVERDDLSPYVRNKLRELIELDRIVDHLEIYTGPLTARLSLRRYFKKIRATLGPIRGVIHSAAVYSDANAPGFANKSLERMRQVWEPKADGLESFQAVFKADRLDFFVSFSSMTGLIPRLARGASDYAMANSFVEFFTAYQHHQRNSSCYKTITWSDWNQTGAITRVADEKAAAVADTFDQLGMRTFSNQEGCTLFELAMTRKADSRVIIGYLDLDRFERVRPQLLHADPDAPEPERPTAAGQPAPMRRTASEAAILHHLERWEAERRRGLEVPVQRITDVISLDEIRRLEPSSIHRMHKVLFGGVAQKAPSSEPVDYAQVIAGTVREVLKLKSLDPSQSFQSYGLDSISAMVLATRLEKKLNREVPTQWLIEFPTVEALSRHLVAQNTESLQE
jgi:acyl transferase domain-containing protein/enoyl-CoA hydratase/carnithine racemase/acyl carrier protein/NAD(P)-dependent dehydrogenase (short-subunit alcohol dehydrogenase family)